MIATPSLRTATNLTHISDFREACAHAQPARMNRRTALATLAAATASAQLPNVLAQESDGPYKVKNGRIKQSVVPWCFNPMKVEELARHSAAMGLQSVELCDPKVW